MYLENIFKVSCKFDKISCKALEKVLNMIMKNDENFNLKIVEVYAKMFKFLIYKDNNFMYCSGLFNLYAQFFT